MEFNTNFRRTLIQLRISDFIPEEIYHIFLFLCSFFFLRIRKKSLSKAFIKFSFSQKFYSNFIFPWSSSISSFNIYQIFCAICFLMILLKNFYFTSRFINCVDHFDRLLICRKIQTWFDNSYETLIIYWTNFSAQLLHLVFASNGILILYMFVISPNGSRHTKKLNVIII